MTRWPGTAARTSPDVVRAKSADERNRAVELAQPPAPAFTHGEPGHADRLSSLGSVLGEYDVPERGEADSVLRPVKGDDLRLLPAQLARLSDEGLEVAADPGTVAAVARRADQHAALGEELEQPAEVPRVDQLLERAQDGTGFLGAVARQR